MELNNFQCLLSSWLALLQWEICACCESHNLHPFTREGNLTYPPAASPPREPPAHLLSDFTINHTVPLEFYYVDDSNRGRGGLLVTLESSRQ